MRSFPPLSKKVDLSRLRFFLGSPPLRVQGLAAGALRFGGRGRGLRRGKAACRGGQVPARYRDTSIHTTCSIKGLRLTSVSIQLPAAGAWQLGVSHSYAKDNDR